MKKSFNLKVIFIFWYLGYVYHMQMSNDGKYIVVAGKDAPVKKYSAKTFQFISQTKNSKKNMIN